MGEVWRVRGEDREICSFHFAMFYGLIWLRPTAFYTLTIKAKLKKINFPESDVLWNLFSRENNNIVKW